MMYYNYVGIVKWSKIVLQWIKSRVRIPNIKIQISRKESCAVEASGTRDHGLYFCIIHLLAMPRTSDQHHFICCCSSKVFQELRGIKGLYKFQLFIFSVVKSAICLLSGLRLEISSQLNCSSLNDSFCSLRVKNIVVNPKEF